MLGARHQTAVLMVLLTLYLFTFSGRFHSIDEIAALATVESLLREGTLRVPQLRWALGWTPTHVAVGVDGALYSKRGLGYSLALAPLWLLGYMWPGVGAVQMAALTATFATLLTVWLLMRFLRAHGVTPERAAWVGAVYGLATPAWPYARYLFSEPLSALLGMMALSAAIRPSEHKATQRAWVTGVVCGLALLVHALNALIILLFGAWWAWWAWCRRRSRPLLAFGVGLLPALLVVGWLNWQRYGHPLNAGYVAPEERFVWAYGSSLPGLLLSPGKGVIWFVPTVFPALIAWPSLWRARRALAAMLAAWVIGWTALVGGWFMWWGGWSWGTRYWVALLPALVIPLGWSGQRFRRLERALLGAAALAGTGINALGALVDFNVPLANIVQAGLPDTTVIWSWAHWPPRLHLEVARQGVLDMAWWTPGPDLAVMFGFVVALGFGVVMGTWAGRHRSGLTLGTVALVAVAAWGMSRHPWNAADITAASVSAIVEAEGRREDVVLLELVPYYDYFTTLQAWMNRYRAPQPYRTVVRGAPVPSDVEALQQGRLWFVTERTPPGDPAAEVERSLLRRMALLDDRWVEEWRLVRFVPLPSDGWQESTHTFVGGITLRAEWTTFDDLLIVRLTWRTARPIPEPFNTFVQVLDGRDQVVSQHNRAPGNGHWPTPTWSPGQPVQDMYAQLQPTDQWSSASTRQQLATACRWPTERVTLPC
ncbi:MAG: hypothetical protein Q9O62_02115 [Ardenticatenia bacterium]|nr:hypothetical protein [Ardenticatenia bacterium]